MPYKSWATVLQLQFFPRSITRCHRFWKQIHFYRHRCLW